MTAWWCPCEHTDQEAHREAVKARWGVYPSMYDPESDQDPREVHHEAVAVMSQP